MKYSKKIYDSSFQALEKKNRGEKRNGSNKQELKVPVSTLRAMIGLGIVK